MKKTFIEYMPYVYKQNNYRCTYNPNPNFKPDCTGTNSTSSTITSGGNTKAPVATTLPNITKEFTLYKNMLPITIPSTVDPMKDSYKSDPDPSVKQFFLRPDEYKYSDLSNTNTWDDFKKALSKCIELENCYAVVVQSDFSGISAADSNRDHSFNYFLVELPTIEKINNNQRLITFAASKQIDNNFLFCQPQFYTWVKNLNSGVYNPYAPRYNPNNTPPSSFRLCPPERYLEQQREEDNANFFKKKEDDDFWAPRDEVPIPFVPPPKKPKEDNTKRNIIIGVVVAIIVLGGGYYWYTHFGPGSTPSATPSSTVAKIVTPAIPKTVSATIKKTKGGYFFY